LVPIQRKEMASLANMNITSRIVKADKVLGTTEEYKILFISPPLLALGGWLS
jgi:hypothetical protein